jgi:hypothetical protein
MFVRPKITHFRHSRVGGNPIKWLIRLDSRLRGNDSFRWLSDLSVLISASCKGLFKFRFIAS